MKRGEDDELDQLKNSLQKSVSRWDNSDILARQVAYEFMFIVYRMIWSKTWEERTSTSRSSWTHWEEKPSKSDSTRHPGPALPSTTPKWWLPTSTTTTSIGLLLTSEQTWERVWTAASSLFQFHSRILSQCSSSSNRWSLRSVERTLVAQRQWKSQLGSLQAVNRKSRTKDSHELVRNFRRYRPRAMIRTRLGSSSSMSSRKKRC